MSQRSVEVLVGRLATDEALRSRFKEDRAAVIDEFVTSGEHLTPVERDALLAIDFSACERFADRVDPRIQKACLRRMP